MSKVLRTMLAVLPRRGSDDISGELFVSAYQHKLGHLPDQAISYIADKAMEKCKWFPTIAECLELLVGWRRYDEHTERKRLAQSLINAEREARRREQDTWSNREFEPWRPTLDEIERVKAEAAHNLKA